MMRFRDIGGALWRNRFAAVAGGWRDFWTWVHAHPVRRHTVRVAARAVAVAVAMVLVSGATLAFFLSRGPIHLEFLTAYAEEIIADALSYGDAQAEITIADSILVWDEQENGLDFRAVGVVLAGPDRKVLFEVPSISVGLSGRALLFGRIAPSRLEMSGANLRLFRSSQGEFGLGVGSVQDAEPDSGALPLDDVLQLVIGGGGGAGAYLTGIAISNSQLAYTDRAGGSILSADEVTLNFDRNDDGLIATASLLLSTEETSYRADFSGYVNRGDDHLQIGVSFTEITPSLLSQFEPALAPLARLNFPISGSVTATVSEDNFVDTLAFDIQGGEGWIAAPEFSAAAVPVTFADLRGSIEDNFSLFTIEDFHFDFDGPTSDISGLVYRDRDAVLMQLDLSGTTLPIENIVRILPEFERPTIGWWAKQHIVGGTVETMDASLSATLPLNGTGPFRMESLTGRFAVSDAEFYFVKNLNREGVPPMRPVVDFDGSGVIHNNSFELRGTQGRLDGTDITLESGTMVIANLADPAMTAIVDITMNGSVGSAFATLSQPPLALIEGLGIDPNSGSGSTNTHLVLDIPMRGEVGLGHVGYRSDSRLTDFALADSTFGHPISDGVLTLVSGDDKMVVEGSLKYGGAPVDVRWTKNFNDNAPFSSRFAFSGDLDASGRRSLGLSFAPYVTGPIGFALTLDTQGAGFAGRGVLDLDMAGAGLRVPAINYVKQAGESGNGNFEFSIDVDGLLTVPRFEVELGSLVAQGDLSLNVRDSLFSPMQIRFDRFVHGQTSVHGTLDIRAPDDGGRRSVDLVVQGDRLDLRGAFDDVLEPSGGGVGMPLRIVMGDREPIREVRIADDAHLGNLHALIEHDGEVWRNVTVVGSLNGDSVLRAELQDDGTVRHLDLSAGNAGDALRAAGWFDTVDGGTLRVVATLPNPPTDQSIIGQGVIEDFTLTDAPVMARLLSLISLKGISSGAVEDGISFEDMTMDFRLINQFIEFPQIKADGNELIIVARGSLDRAQQTLDMSGEVAPATTLNTLMGLTSIPLLGDLLGGDGGVFAATFALSGSVDRPELSANPLSVLTPGFMRRILDVFTGGAAELPSESGEISTSPPLQEGE